MSAMEATGFVYLRRPANIAKIIFISTAIEEALLLKQAFLGGPTGPGTGFGERRSFPSHPRWRDPRILHHPGPGIIGGANIGVPGVIPVPGGGHIHVPVPNSVRDKSERINLNLTIHNNNENVHDQRGSGRVTVIQGDNIYFLYKLYIVFFYN